MDTKMIWWKQCLLAIVIGLCIGPLCVYVALSFSDVVVDYQMEMQEVKQEKWSEVKFLFEDGEIKMFVRED